jgi:hypothetical protein
MKRRDFLYTAGAAPWRSAWDRRRLRLFLCLHNWEKHDFGPGPSVADRLYQGPFPQYAPEEVVPGSNVVMTTTPSSDIVSNYGMGLTVYVSGDYWPPRTQGDPLEKYCEDLISLPFAQKVYGRLNWRDVQTRPGRLDFPEGWKIAFDVARRHGKRIGFRVMLENPDHPDPGMPEFLMAKVPYVALKGQWERKSPEPRRKPLNQMPRYDHPEYQAAFKELNGLLAAELNGHPQVEYMDTFMYGFWGEGHSWPYEGHPFPDDVVAEKTWMQMFEAQLDTWTKTPLVTNTQPDFSRVGNSELLDRTVADHNWIRTDTIFIENEQIEPLSNRPPWAAAICEAGMPGDPSRLLSDDGLDHTRTSSSTSWTLARTTGRSGTSTTSPRRASARCTRSAPTLDRRTRIGYRVRPRGSGLREGRASRPRDRPRQRWRRVSARGASPHRLQRRQDDQRQRMRGFGCPMTRGVRQAMLPLPRGTDWKGFDSGELEVKDNATDRLGLSPAPTRTAR